MQMNYWVYKYRGMFKIKMIHFSSYPMLQHGGGVNIALCEPRRILVKGRLTTARMNTYMHDYRNMHILPSDK